METRKHYRLKVQVEGRFWIREYESVPQGADPHEYADALAKLYRERGITMTGYIVEEVK